MARTTAFLVAQLSSRVSEARDLAQAAEGSSSFLYTRRLYIYEAAYLLAFSAWENMLEQCFLRFLCGYGNGTGVPARTGTWIRASNVTNANITLLAGKQFLLWHNPAIVVARSKGYFAMGPHEVVLTSALSEVEDFAAIRHYVAHRNHDTELKFQSAATRLTGAPIQGGRAGRLLRSTTTDPVTGAQVTWLERIAADLERYALQIAG